MKYICFTQLIAVLLLFSSSAGGKDDFFFCHLGVENGLSQASVISIFQDSKGFLWFGTRNGLNRYDGYEFNVFRRETNDSLSLSDNYIYAIAEDSEKNIWIGTSDGFNCIDCRSGAVSRFYPSRLDSLHQQNLIYRFLRHTDGNLYAISDKGAFLCRPDKTAEPVSFLREITDTNIQAIAQHPNGDIYVGTVSRGLYVYSPDWQLRYSLMPGVETGAPAPQITCIAIDKEGIAWIGTEENGLFAYDAQKRAFSHWDVSNTGLSNNTIRALAFLTNDSLLIGTFGGLNIMNKRDRSIRPQKMKVKEPGRLSHYSIHSLLIDKDSTVWIGTYSEGINYYSPYYAPVSFIATNEVAGIIGKGQEDKDGNMWFATEGSGLLYYNPQTAEKKLYPLMPLQTGNYEKNILKYILIQGDTIYCSTHFGSVYCFLIPSRQYVKLLDCGQNDIYSLYLDSRQRLWAPTYTGNHLVRYENGKMQTSFCINGVEKPFRRITVIKELRPGRFMFGSLHDSLYVYDDASGATENLAPAFYAINQGARLGGISAITPDDSCLWVSTTRCGLFRLDGQLRPVKHYGREEGLTDNHISSVTLDGKRDVWVATQRDIYKLNRDEDAFHPLHTTDIPRQEYSMYAGTLASDGTLYFSGNKGILSFNPLNKRKNPGIPPLYITSFAIHTKEGAAQMMQIENEPQAKPLRLRADQNNIRLAYTALNYIHPEENSYMYQLHGDENGWHTTARREVRYNNLPPGNYTFRIRAANNDGVVNPRETTLSFIISPPFYHTWWAYLLYVTMLTLIIRWIFRRQYRRMEQKRLNEIQEERMRMFANFSHELRTQLTLLLNPLNDLQQRASFSTEVKQLLQLMKKNAERMKLQVNDLMDIQKYEAGKIVLQKSVFDFPAFINEICRSFESVAGNRKIAFQLHSELPEKYAVCYDAKEMEKVFFNLLSNAFKFTPPHGTVSLHIKRLERKGHLYIQISDTGKGFDPQEAQKIFEPFYIAASDVHQQVSGTGIGLSLTRSIVLQHKGCIWAESAPQGGAKFMLLLPDTERPEGQPEGIQPEARHHLDKKTSLLLEEAAGKDKPILLLVDDNEDILQYMAQQFEAAYIVQQAADGAEALECARKKPPHLILSDVVMPRMSGVELCRHIKADKRLCHIPFILITGNTQDEQVKNGLEAGADDYIVKPFDIALLKIRIRNLLLLRQKIKDVYSETSTLKHFGIEDPGAENDFLAQYIEIIKSNISNQDFNIAAIYESLGMSRANFYRKVKARTDLSPIDLIRHLRLEAGARLLQESHLNISEIALHIGFGSSSYFTRNFREVYGMSPTEYQKMMANPAARPTPQPPEGGVERE
jgi:signal transduction histidine kinase/ligand-binding sensor domain-containing protein/CheY-like chemotaxis protein/AraC-like DNA-binding protein